MQTFVDLREDIPTPRLRMLILRKFHNISRFKIYVGVGRGSTHKETQAKYRTNKKKENKKLEQLDTLPQKIYGYAY